MNETDKIIEKFLKHVDYKIKRTDDCSIHQLARELNMSYSTLQSNLSCRSSLSFSTGIKLARHFDIDMNQLILHNNTSQKLFNLIDNMDEKQKELAYNVLKVLSQYVNEAKSVDSNKK